MLEDIPRHGPELAKELLRVGAEIKEAAQKELAEFYLPDPDGSKPIAYLWARTVRCESPNCGAEIPLVRSFWLCKKANRKRALRVVIESVGAAPCGRPDKGQAQGPAPTKTVRFEIFEPKSDKDVPPGTVTRAKATCLCCNTVLSPNRVRAQLAQHRGGADVLFDEKGQRVGGAQLLAVVTLVPGEQGRHYRLPTERDYNIAWRATKQLGTIAKARLENGLSLVPDEPTPSGGGSGAGRAFSVQKYGMMTFADLFTARQKLALVAVARNVRGLPERSELDTTVKAMLALVLNRCADYSSSLCSWHLTGEKINHTFGRQALPIIWDFTEVNLWCDSSGNFDGALNWGVLTARYLGSSLVPRGQSQIADACAFPLPDDTVGAWFTDPPYYDAVPYAELSDFFFIWLKRTLPGHPPLRDPFDATNMLTPKTREIVQDEVKQVDGLPKDREFFEKMMAKAFSEGRRVLKHDGVGCVVFAHKTTEGWEALLSGMVQGGWVVTGSWPIATEMGARLRARESAALTASIHLVCRPRTENKVGDWGEVLRELPNRVGDWMERLQSEGIRGADLVFACIGPALEIFSRYSKVETAEGREVA